MAMGLVKDETDTHPLDLTAKIDVIQHKREPK